ncbi:MAG: sulfatase [Verrucomicrobia bacterium]|nr:sulfatase [Verrucomicrobiota bacterium]
MKPFLAILFSSFFLLPSSFAAPQRPNIVFIIADDLGWADVAFHGGNAPTPHLDRLAREGLELAQHYVAPVCSPTRTGLMTGRYWSRFGVTSPQNERALPWDTVTLPRALKSAGYDTCLTGKWHLGSLPEQGPNHFGFDHSYGSLAGGVTPYSLRYKQGPYSHTWHRNEKLIEEQGHVTDLITAEAVRWIESRGNRPFFLYVPFTAVHLPIREPDEWLARVPANITGDVPRHYAACIMHLDDAVGKILAALDKKGVRENTIVVFTSDNGGSTAENNDRKYPDDNCPNGRLTGNNLPLRGKKGDLYEGGVRVPTIASWPGKLKHGMFNGVAHICDWMPTFCALAGYQPSHDLKWDGQNLWPQLTGAESARPRAIYGAAPGFRARMVRDGDWKLIVKQDSAELFDLARDPNETTDLSAKEPGKVAALRAKLAELSRADKDALAEPRVSKSR